VTDRLIVFTYHRVLDGPDPLRPGEADVASFTDQIRATARVMNILPLAEAVERWRERRLPARAAAITFDDGYLDNHEVARPILEREGVPATFFIATDFIAGGCMWNDVVIDAVERTKRNTFDAASLGLGTLALGTIPERAASIDRILAAIKYLPLEGRVRAAQAVAQQLDVEPPKRMMMDETKLRDLASRGFEIGAHTASHPILRTLPEERAREQISGSKHFLEKLLGRKVSLFAYPNGRPGDDFSSREMALVQEAGFSAGFSTRAAVVDGAAESMALPRISPWDRNPLKLAVRLLAASWTGRI
jgi:peptidoglycan/xylan/chitin deacetylase (PgdA/CDA1 family)